ncbi:caldesmon isoform X4 [Anomaloglossus baeobatrachus]|uniref:caldesmon isoform X4 n=1 Tax=Anomaloglossus baeobatrachus TaxID=238106 RepID=UPI003F4F717C
MDDFERRRELRRQKREEMRQEVERTTYQRNDDDEEEAARERRRRARQERQRLNKDDVEGHDGTQNSITSEESPSIKSSSITNTELSVDDESALLERLAKREERRQKRLQEAMERQKELDPTISISVNETISVKKSSRNGENEVQENDTSPKENNTEAYRGRHEVEETETFDKSFEKNDRKEVEHVETEEVEVKQEEQEEEPEEPHIEENQVKDEKSKDKGGKEELKASWERKNKAQNGESLHEVTPQKLKHMDKFGGAKGQASFEETEPGTKVEAGKKLEDLKRRRGESETGELDKLKQKQQDAAVELEELKKKREGRRKIMEEEEQKKKQEESEKKAKEEEEKKKLKEDIERRRAEAAEKRQKVTDDGSSEEKKPFKCFTPKGSAFKIEERAEFLNRSAQKSVKSAQPSVVSKIDSRLEQYTSAIGNNKGPKAAKQAPADLPLATEGVRNIKSMWEKGNVFSSPSGIVSPNKETAGLKVGVSSRINEWLTKTPENNKSPSTKPSDLRPGDVSGKRNIWEKQQTEKPGSPTKMTTGGKKSDSNGLRFEKEP